MPRYHYQHLRLTLQKGARASVSNRSRWFTFNVDQMLVWWLPPEVTITDRAATTAMIPYNANMAIGRTFFRPMECRTHRRITDVGEEREAYDLMIKGFSPNYKGNPDLERNRRAQSQRQDYGSTKNSPDIECDTNRRITDVEAYDLMVRGFHPTTRATQI
ncbi:hypothetical protein QBC43DRAFT_293041 [Cladorrhinum sp. PSN259]|nr:hypothetical protein QBC43DRAFT_293041 [Cladorrhinum sp. PSN259]